MCLSRRALPRCTAPCTTHKREVEGPPVRTFAPLPVHVGVVSVSLSQRHRANGKLVAVRFQRPYAPVA
jgi:hypothetical protein